MNTFNNSNNREIGMQGEAIAQNYLENKGYEILYKNFRTKFGEIDLIIRKELNSCLIFVEVKTLMIKTSNQFTSDFLEPEDNLSFSKLKKLKRICQFFSNSHPELVDDSGWRIDLITILIKDNEKYSIKQYKNI